jgi:hypothetical protein
VEGHLDDETRVSTWGVGMLAEQLSGNDAPSPVAQRSGESSASQNRTTKVGPDKDSPTEIGTRQLGPAEVRSPQVSSPEEGMHQSSTVQIGTPEISPA